MPRSAAKRIEELEAQLAALQTRLAALEPTPGLEGSRERWTVQVGGEPVELRALTDEQWVAALGELPSFLLTYLGGRQVGQNNDPEILKRAVATAQAWILACALEPSQARLERLTVPEALEAVKVIAGLNGIDDALAKFFRTRLVSSAPRHSS